VWDACRAALSANGLSVIQSPGFDHTEHGVTVPVETLLMHTSGQWVRGVIAVPVSKVDAHGVGSANTYGRRYALAAFVGIAPEDDDGVAAVGQGAARVTTAAPAEPSKAPTGYDAWMTDFISAADEGMDAMKAAWKASDPAIRAWAEAHDRAALTGIKGKAAKVRQVVAS
jgi:hypothetical protein